MQEEANSNNVLQSTVTDFAIPANFFGFCVDVSAFRQGQCLCSFTRIAPTCRLNATTSNLLVVTVVGISEIWLSTSNGT